MFDQVKKVRQNPAYTGQPGNKNTTREPPICPFEKLQGKTSVTFGAGKALL